MQQIISNFESFMGKNGTRYYQFYVGIASNLRERLANGHNIDNSIPCIWSSKPLNTNIVRQIEKYFLDKGCKGDTGGGNEATKHVYAYLITNQTKQ